MRIVLTGGGTGGHLFPLIAVAQQLKKNYGPDAQILYIGSGNELEKSVVAREGIAMKHVLSGKRRRYFSFKNFIDLFKVPIGIIQSLWILLWFMPDVIFSKGGYVSVPVVISAWLYRIPILIHESDAIPGSANQMMAKLSKRVAVSYPSAEHYFPSAQVVLTGNPIRPEILEGNIDKARQRFNFTQSKPVILVMGGSQGSQIINESIIKILPRILDRAQVIHQTGEKNYEEVVRLAGEFGVKAGREGYMPVKFLDSDSMRDALAVADLVISRAGANAISEIAANLKATILIPLYNSANEHQQMNAYELARIGGALVLEETNLGENILWGKIEMLLGDENLRKNMGQKMKAFYHADAAERIAKGLVELVHG